MEDLPNLKFRLAKTMPQIPHQYVVRNLENEEAYAELFRTIEALGVWETRKDGIEYQYWYRGDGWKYWRMDNDLAKSQVINRASVVEA